ncbi:MULTISPECIES: hypothetical protein [unclassified Nocardioides]|nr:MULTISPECIES: hypothetical protein [unclassified Nocardioides]
MDQQRIPGVVDAGLSPISERAYGTLTAIAVLVATLAIVLVAQWR